MGERYLSGWSNLPLTFILFYVCSGLTVFVNTILREGAEVLNSKDVNEVWNEVGPSQR